MQFHSTNKTGKSGERAVETFVEDTLNFAYRRTDKPDIGIDGEIEVLDANGVGTGGLLKVQVKTMAAAPTGKRIRVPLDEGHLDYFAALTVPPVLMVVSLAAQQIWWKPILHKDNYLGAKLGYGVTLDLHADKLTRHSGALLQMIGNRSNAMIAKYLLEEMEAHLAEMDEVEAGGEYDYITADNWAATLRNVDRTMRDASCLLRYERRYSAEITAIEDRFDALRDVIAVRKDWFKAHDVGELLTEPRWGDED